MALCRMVFDPPEVSAYRSDESRGGTHIFDLPLAVLSRILSQILDPVSAAHVICSCKMFRVLSKSAPFSFKVSCAKLENKAADLEEKMQKKHSLTAVRTWTRRLLSSVRSQMPMTRVLDLSGCWIVDEDVAAVLADLRCLKCLILDGCQKLTSAVADALAVSVRSGPRALSLQRCFGLCPAAAGNLLAAAAAEGSQLQCVFLSHLDRIELPRYPPLLDAQEFDIIEATKSAGTLNANLSYNSCVHMRRGLNNIGDRSFGISVLALHNCGNFGAHELAAVGVTCPCLEFLFIGGSIEALCRSGPDSSSLEVSTMAVAAIADSLKFLRCLRVLEATFFPEFVLQGLRGQVGGVEVWDFCERKSVCSALNFLSSQVASEQAFHRRNKIISLQPSKAEWNFDGINETADYVSLALRAAVNCSDLRRRTPLHVAANEADTETVRGLLSMGASLQLKDSTGATALFDAAWNGHADICRLLLMGGADMLSRNRSGENPLYAAALKGHTSVVKIFVSHCKASNIDWQSAEVYGDGWTPLMAAAVADRHDVAKVLIEAAGLCLKLGCSIKGCLLCRKKDSKAQENKFSMEQEREASKFKNEDAHQPPDKMPTINTSSPILDAQNRYGQTALHIAARRGSEWFVSYLLHAGASLNIGDEYKKRPVDVAQKQKHTVVTNLLKQWELQLKRVQLGNGCDIISAREQSPADEFTAALSHIHSESFPVKGSCNGGLDSAALKQVWRAKEKNGLL